MKQLGRRVLAALVFLCLRFAICGAQVKVELTNEVGAKGPCLGLGIGMALVGKCVSRAEAQGFVRVDEVGVSGLTIGVSGPKDGMVTAVQAGSAAATAGITKGDQIVSVDGHLAAWTPAMEFQRQTFGERDDALSLTVRPAAGGLERPVTLTRSAAPMPKDMPSGSLLVPLMVLVDWRGRYVPCTAGGPMTPAVNAICAKEYAKYGYIRAKQLGQTGVDVGAAQDGGAVVTAADTAAAKAGINVGDVVLAVNGKPLSGSKGELATMYLFGKEGTQHEVVVSREGKNIPVKLVLQKQ